MPVRLFHIVSVMWVAVVVCCSSPRTASAETPILIVSGLPCPGGQGEPTNSHPLVWNLRSGTDALPRSWRGWQNSTKAGYGDVLTATWFSDCSRHAVDWDCARLDLFWTNGAGDLVTNSSTVRMKAGCNFLISYIYWYTNGSLGLWPTNFLVAESPVLNRTNTSLLLSQSAGIRGLEIAPPLWAQSGPIDDPVAWPLWGTFQDGYPHWPPWQTNLDGALVIAPSAQLPACELDLNTNSTLTLSIQALPGNYTAQSATDLADAWTNRTMIEAAADGRGIIELPLDPATKGFLRVQGLNPLKSGIGYTVRFDTVGSDFSPVVFCANGLPDQLLWTWSDATTSSDFPLATKDFGSDDARSQHLTVIPAAALTAINLGFDASDGGETTPLSNRPPQNVSGVYFPYPLTSLQYWCSSYNPITNTLDFTGFSSLEAIECFHCTNLPNVIVSNLPALKRVCFEHCDLQQLVLTADPNLEDVRAAVNAYTNIVLAGGTGPKIWHFCTRDNEQLTQDLQEIMTNFYSLREPWIWHDNQNGALRFVSTNLTDVEFQDNFYSFADFSQQPNLQIIWGFDNRLTNVVLSGCDSLQDLELQNNLLTGAALDSILAALDLSATNLMVANLTDNPGSPSAIGYEHYANLTNRGAIVYLDFLATNPPAIAYDSTTLTAESCLPPNNAIDPGETVTLQVAFRNRGLQDTADLVITLLETNGVVGPSGPQDYGQVVAGGGAVARPFSFTANGDCGATAVATFHLQDGANDLGTVALPFDLGLISAVFAQSFDSVSAPALPADWSTTASGAQPLWITTTILPDTGFNAAFSDDAPDIGVNELVSPLFSIPATQTRLTFRNNFDLEPGDAPGIANDGGVLEIKIGAGPFEDILAAGGTFIAGAYTSTITNIWSNPLAGSSCWSGNSGGYITTRVNLPAAAAGQAVQFRWRCATDNGNSGNSPAGWRIDTVKVETIDCCQP